MFKPIIQIIEDDPNYAAELEEMLTDLGYEVLPTIQNPQEVNFKGEQQADLVISDVFFSGKPLGIHLVRQLQPQGIPVILMTANTDEEVYRQSRVNLPSGYVIRPVPKLTLHATIERALLQHDQLDVVNRVFEDWNRENLVKKYLFIRHKKALVKLEVEKIDYIIADGNYCYIHEGGRRYAVKNSLKQFKQALNAQGFLQVNRGQILNYRRIEKVSFSQAQVYIGEEQFPIGDTFRKEVADWLHRL